MPITPEELRSRYSPEQLRNALESLEAGKIFARDNTKTGGVTDGYVPAKDRPVPDRSDVRFDDGPVGFIPIVGDILQGAQVYEDFKNKKYKQAALGAGLLLLPNVLAEPIKAGARGISRSLRRMPNGTIPFELASDIVSGHPYKGSNAIYHGIELDDMLPVLRGENRTITPSMSIGRIQDFNEIGNLPAKYGDFTFVGDKSLLAGKDHIIFTGDAMSPTVAEAYTKHGSIPSEEYDDVAERLWQMTIKGENKAVGPTIKLENVDTSPIQDLGYFEAIRRGTVPYTDFKYVLAPEPGTLRANPMLGESFVEKNKLAEKVINALEKEQGMKVSTYNNDLHKYAGYNDWAEKMLDVLSNTNNGVLFEDGGIMLNDFASGGKIHINPKNRGKFNATKARTGKTTEELTHSKNPLTRKRAIFAQNAAKWNHKHAEGGFLDNDYSTGYLYNPDIVTQKPQVQAPSVVASPIDYNELKRRQYYIESRFNNKAVSHAGAKGAYQIMPITYKDYVQRTGKEGDLNDYAYNEGIRDYYMNRHLNSSWATKNNQSEWNRVAKSLAAYNWGAGNLLKHLESEKAAGKDIYQGKDWADTLPKETRNYIRWILDGQDIGDKITNKAYEKAKKKRFDLGGKIERYGVDRVREALKKMKQSK